MQKRGNVRKLFSVKNHMNILSSFCEITRDVGSPGGRWFALHCHYSFSSGKRIMGYVRLRAEGVIHISNCRESSTETGCCCVVRRRANPGLSVLHGGQKSSLSYNYLFPEFLEFLFRFSVWRIFPRFCYVNPFYFCSERHAPVRYRKLEKAIRVLINSHRKSNLYP